MKLMLTPLSVFALLIVGQGNLDLPSGRAVPKPGQVVAKVNGQAITAGEVAPLLWEWRGHEAIQDVISYAMVAQEAAKKGIVVGPPEVTKAVDEERKGLAASMGVPLEKVDANLLEQGFTRSRLTLRVKSRLLVDKIAEKAFDPKQYVRVSTIVYRPKSEQIADLTEAINRAQAAHDRLAKGEDWAKLLAEATKEPAVLKNGGSLGWKEVGAFPASVQKEFPSLKLGGYPKPAQTANGIQVFRLDARGSDAKGAELTALKAAYLVGARQATIDRLRAQTKIERVWK